MFAGLIYRILKNIFVISGKVKIYVFYEKKITEMNYGSGSHTCNPRGNIVYSSKIYINKHMSSLGLNFLTNKHIERYKRNAEMRKIGCNTHYMDNIDKIKNLYSSQLNQCKLLD
jgi:hypothetical protein